MAWIELHQTLPSNKKTIRLKKLLGIKTPQVVGHLCLLWLWALDNAPDGNMSAFSADEIAEVTQWTGKNADDFLAALVQAGFIDSDMQIHDWYAYAGKLVTKRERNAERMRGARATNVHNTCNARAENMQDTCDACAGATVPNRTVPITPLTPLPGEAPAPKRKKPSTLSVAQQALFNRFWSAYPRKESIGDAERAWDKLNADEALTDTIVAGIERAIGNDHRFREKQYIPHPASWLNGKDWLNEYDDTQEPTRRHRRVN